MIITKTQFHILLSLKSVVTQDEKYQLYLKPFHVTESLVQEKLAIIL